MKRSEMVTIIKKVLDVRDSKQGTNCALFTTEVEAFHLLRILEMKGMTPPKIMKPYAGGQDFGVHEWEAEEEKCYTCKTKCGKCVIEEN